jgi:poly(A) polymerase
MQARFEYRQGRRPYTLLEHPRFRAAYDFFLLRCESGEIDVSIAQWWQQFVEADANSRAAMVLPETSKSKSKRRRRRKRNGGQAADNSATGGTDQHDAH